MKKIVLFALTVVALIVGAVAVYWFSPYQIAIVDTMATAVMQPASTALPPQPFMPGPIVISRLKLSENLEIASMSTEGVVIVSQDNAPVEFAGIQLYKPDSTTVTLKSVGEVRAGVAWSGIASTVADTGALIVILPEPQILGWEPDTEQSYFVEFDEPLSWGILTIGAVRPDTITYIQDLARQEAIRQACNASILQAVNDRAVERFSQLLKAIDYQGYQQYTGLLVHTTPPGDCQP